MKKLFISVLIGLFAMALLPQMTQAQFGKNMVVKGVNWKIYESEHFEIYYYFPNKDDWAKEKEHIKDMIRWTETAYKQISEEIKYDMPVDDKKHGKPRIFFYWSRYDASHHPMGPGGAIAYAEPLQMREICVSKEFPDEKIQQIVTHETSHLFQYSLWNLAKKPYSQLARIWNKMLTFLFEGHAQHTSGLHRTMPNARLVLRYWVLNDGLRYINIKDWVHPALSRSYEICYVLAGYFYDYIKETYGELTFANFVKEFRRKKPTAQGFEKAVFQVLKTDFAELDRGFRKYLEDQYKHFPVEKKEALDYGRDILVNRSLKDNRKGSVYEPVISPSEDLIAGFIVKGDSVRVALISIKDGTIVKELSGGHSLYKYGLYPVVDLEGPGRALCFSPDGDHILYFAQTAGKNPVLVTLGVVTGKVNKIEIELDDPETPEISKDGKTVIFSAIQNGQRDIFSLNLETKEVENLTNDETWDYAPSYDPEEKTIVYVASIANYHKLFTLDLVTKEKKQLTFGPTNETRPICSKDGKTIWFISDQDKDKTKNIYILNLEDNTVIQWTDVINGIYNVIPLKDNKLLMGAVGYRDSRNPFAYNLYDVDFDKIKPVADANDLIKPKEIEEPETPKIEIGEIDPTKIRKYSTKFHLDQGMFYGSIDTRYGIYGWGYLSFSDLTATKYIQVSVMKFGKYYTNNALTYFNLSRRLWWGVAATSENHYFYPWYTDYWFSPYGQPRFDLVLYYLRLKQNKLTTIFQYPIDLCHRLEFSLSGASVKYDHLDWSGYADYYASLIETTPLPDNPIWQRYPEGYRELYLAYLTNEKGKGELRDDFIHRYINGGKFATFHIGFVRDTALYKYQVGPFTNDMYRIDLSWSTGGHNITLATEGRKYFRLGSEWVFALRGYAGAQWGKTITPWVIGDLGELRGYQWMQFMGNQITVVNAELRFPLVKNFNLFGLYLGDIRAALFADVGKIGFDDKRFNLLNDDDVNPSSTKGSVGIDLSLPTTPILGIPLHVAFSKRMTKIKLFPSLEKDWQIKIYLGYSF